MDKLKCYECGAETTVGCDKIKALSCSCGGMKVKPVEVEWISVKDRLPEKNTHYLCCFSCEGNQYQDILYYAKDGGFPDNITHWMPLPKLPKVD
jgi:hypothetical protein